MFHHRKNSKDSVTSPLSPTSSISSTSPTSPKAFEPRKINTISTLSELEELLEDHHHKHIVVFCLTSQHKDPDVEMEGWYFHYERLNNMHFVKVEIDKSEELEERLQPKVKPCWFTFHKGSETGWASGGMKRFVQVHSERRHST